MDNQQVVAGGGVAAIALGLAFLVRPLLLLRNGRRASGTVTDLDRDEGTFPIVTFTPDEPGPPVTFRSPVSTFGRLAIGDRVPVLYPQGKPQRAIVATFSQLYGVPIALVVFGTLFTAATLYR